MTDLQPRKGQPGSRGRINKFNSRVQIKGGDEGVICPEVHRDNGDVMK